MDSDVDILGQQIDRAIVHHHLKPELWVRLEKFAKLRNQMEPCKRDRRADPQATLEARAKPLRGGVSFVRLRERSNGAFVECDAGFGGRYASRGAR
jgi:hypothetical protein